MEKIEKQRQFVFRHYSVVEMRKLRNSARLHVTGNSPSGPLQLRVHRKRMCIFSFVSNKIGFRTCRNIIQSRWQWCGFLRHEPFLGVTSWSLPCHWKREREVDVTASTAETLSVILLIGPLAQMASLSLRRIHLQYCWYLRANECVAACECSEKEKKRAIRRKRSRILEGG